MIKYKRIQLNGYLRIEYVSKQSNRVIKVIIKACTCTQITKNNKTILPTKSQKIR